MVLSQRFTEALLWATELHQQQVRKGSGVPYIAHLLGVTSEALEYGATEDEAIAALLHDAIEDCGGRPIALEIRRRFGDNVAEIVEGCTDAVTQPKPPGENASRPILAICAPPPPLSVSSQRPINSIMLAPFSKIAAASVTKFGSGSLGGERAVYGTIAPW